MLFKKEIESVKLIAESSTVPRICPTIILSKMPDRYIEAVIAKVEMSRLLYFCLIKAAFRCIVFPFYSVEFGVWRYGGKAKPCGN